MVSQPAIDKRVKQIMAQNKPFFDRLHERNVYLMSAHQGISVAQAEKKSAETFKNQNDFFFTPIVVGFPHYLYRKIKDKFFSKRK